MNINEIQDLIKFVAKAGVNEVEIEKKDFKKSTLGGCVFFKKGENLCLKVEKL